MLQTGVAISALVLTAGPSRRLEEPGDAVRRCANALIAAQGKTTLAAVGTAMIGCKGLFVEEKCRKVFQESAEQQPQTIIAVLSGTLRVLARHIL